MRSPPRSALVALLGLAPALVAWRLASDPLTLQPSSRLWIDGNSTMRRFSCRATEFTLDVDAAPGAVTAVLAAPNGVVRTATLTVPAAKLECGNATMNEHLRKALKASDAPAVEFRLASYDAAPITAGVEGTLRGTLTLGGAARPVTITARAAAVPDGALRVTGACELHMTEFGLKPPTLMLGTLKVDERVVVNFDLILKSGAVAALERGL